jgi:hypothetical protein
MSIFAVSIVSSLRFNKTPIAKWCPTNKAPAITIRTAQLASASLVLTEMISNEKFKKQSQKSIDLAFVKDKQASYRKENNTSDTDSLEPSVHEKQLQSFEELISIYESKQGQLKTKRDIYIAQQLAFAAALGVELGFMATCKAQCAADQTATDTKYSLNLAALKLCPTAAPLAIKATAKKVKNEVEGAKDQVQEMAWATKNINDFTKVFETFEESSNVDEVKTSGFKKLIGKITGTEEKEKIKENKKSIITKADIGVCKANLGAIVGAVAAGMIPPPPAPNPNFPTCSHAMTTVVPVLKAVSVKPILCCGNKYKPGPSVCTAVPVQPGNHEHTRDVEFKKLIGGDSKIMEKIKKAKGALDLGKSFKGSYIDIEKPQGFGPLYPEFDTKEYFEAVVSSIVSDYVLLDESYKKYNNPHQRLLALHKRLSNPAYEIRKLFKNANHKSLNSLIAQSSKHATDEEREVILKMFYQIKSHLFVQDAKADFGKIMEYLGYAAGLVVAAEIFKPMYQKFAASKPLNRSILWGVLNVLNGVNLAKTVKDKKGVDKYVKDVKREYERYKEAIFEKESMELQKYQAAYVKRQRARVSIDTTDIKGCMDIGGNSYVPTTCPSKLGKSHFKMRTMDRKISSKLTSPHLNALKMTEAMSSDILGGKLLSNSNLIGGHLAGASNGNRAAMRRRNNKLMKGIDEMNKKGLKEASKLLNKDLPFGPASMVGAFDSATNAAQALDGTPASAPNSVANNDLEEKAKAAPKTAAVSIPNITPPPASSDDFDLDFGEDEEDVSVDEIAEAKEEQNLGDFELDQNDIVKKPEVSIFKILSNRYILSYPKVLEEETAGSGVQDN